MTNHCSTVVREPSDIAAKTCLISRGQSAATQSLHGQAYRTALKGTAGGRNQV
jgi:hypothetical protein